MDAESNIGVQGLIGNMGTAYEDMQTWDVIRHLSCYRLIMERRNLSREERDALFCLILEAENRLGETYPSGRPVRSTTPT